MLVSVQTSAAAPALKLVATEWAPYTTTSEVSQGVAAQIVKAVLKRAGYDVEIHIMPWLRAQNLVKKGLFDGLSIAWYTEQRAKTLHYSKPYLLTEIVLIKNAADTRSYSEPEGLRDKNFGILRGYGYLSSIPVTDYHTTMFDTLEQSFQVLARGRIDLTLEEKLNAQHRLAKMEPAIRNRVVFDRPLEVRPLHMTLSKQLPNHRQIVDDFNRALEQMIEDGSYQQILDSRDLPLRSVANPQ